MGRPLSQRLARIKESRKRAERVNDMTAAFAREVEKRFPLVEEADDRAELQEMLRNPKETARSRMFAHMRTYRGIAQEVESLGLDTDGQMAAVRDWIDGMELGAHHGIEDHEGYSDQEIWQRDRSDDLKNNFLFLDYLETVSHVGYRNYAVHLDYRAIRSAIKLLTTHTDGEEKLRELYGEELEHIRVPSRLDAIRFKESPDYQNLHPEAWIEDAIRAVPGIYSAGHILLTTYSEFVGIERQRLTREGREFEDTPLPIDFNEITELDGEDSMSLDQRRMEAAITAYASGEGNVLEIHQIYNVPQHKLRKELKVRGLMRGRGGDVREYRVPDHREEG